jgi:hypothetical protein
MFGGDLGLISAVYAALFIFGFAYNVLVAWLERRGYHEGYTAILVVGGTLITLSGVAIVDWRAAALALGAFACSGFWMVVGSWWRHVQARRAGQEAQREDLL